MEQAWAWQGRIDLLINNAGVSQRSLALDTSFDVYRQLIDIDYLAPVALTQLLLPRLVEQGSGQLAVVSSVAGKLGAPMRTGYCGAKHAVVGYFEALRAEVEEAYGIASA
ncbi:SDR family NAD(P)-dependent oxidoreductase [Halopseudomonas pachastrellae]|nr:SDR family NAD(P)-dependent oxidoreductase [Halopseudomonas pachastrellae]